MSTFFVCTRCGTTQEVAAIDQLPRLWQREGSTSLCPRCTGLGDDARAFEEAVDADEGDDTVHDFPEEDCTACGGPCRGH